MTFVNLFTSLAVSVTLAFAAFHAPKPVTYDASAEVDTGTDGNLGIDADANSQIDADLDVTSAVELKAQL